MAKINLQKVVNVKGKPGLFHLNAYNPKGYHLQPFENGPVVFVSNEKGKVLALGNVDLKLKEGSINLMDVFIKMIEQPPKKDGPVSEYFFALFPDLDRSIPESQLQKVASWFHLINVQASEIINEEDDGLMIT